MAPVGCRYRNRSVLLYIFFEFCFTLLSELYHVHISKSRTFKEIMPMVSSLKIGIALFIQNLILPTCVAKVVKALIS